MGKVLVLLTNSYPYSNEEYSFLTGEVGFYPDYFDSVWIVPSRLGEPAYPLPAGIRLDVSFAKTNTTVQDRARALCAPILWQHIADQQRLREHLAMLAYAYRLKRWLRGFFDRFSPCDKLVLYSYWMGPLTFGALLAAKNRQNTKVVSRAHGGDLFERAGRMPPFQSYIVSGADAVFSVSKAGADFLVEMYPNSAKKIRVAPLGIRDPGRRSSLPESDEIHIVSCSGLSEIKRVPLIAEVVARAGRKLHQKVCWYHFGDGVQRDEVEQICRGAFSAKDHYEIFGDTPNAKVLEFYRTNLVDLFVNLSTSEGVPVSIMEAQAFGIPVLATNVGGVSALISDKNGALVPVSSSASEIPNMIIELLRNVNRLMDQRICARKTWENRSNAEAVFPPFVESLANII